MKEVLISPLQSQGLVFLSQYTEEQLTRMFYGVVYKPSSNSMLLTSTPYCGFVVMKACTVRGVYDFELCSFSSVLKGRFLGGFEACMPSLKEYLTYLIRCRQCSIFAFEKEKELMKWLIDEREDCHEEKI